jgi:hypothetical protein
VDGEGGHRPRYPRGPAAQTRGLLRPQTGYLLRREHEQPGVPWRGNVLRRQRDERPRRVLGGLRSTS